MSSDIFNPKLIKVKDPIIELNEKVVYPVIQGGAETTERVFNSNTYSTTSIQFSCPPPNPKTFVSRRFLLKLKCRFVARIRIETNANTGMDYSSNQFTPSDENFLLANGYDSFRQYPLNSIIRTLNLTINGNTVTLPTNEIIKPLLLYHASDRKLEARESSFSPSMRDQSMDYPDLLGTHINPLGRFGDGDYRDEGPRGGFPITPVSVELVDQSTDLYDITFDADLVEELFISPLIFGGGRCQNEGFINVQSIDINITFDPNIAKCWSHMPGAITMIGDVPWYYSLNSFEFDSTTPFPNPPAILFRYVTPPYGMNIPRAVQYCYNVIDRYITDIKPSNTDEFDYNTNIVNAITNNVQLNSIPRFLYLFIRRKSENNIDDTLYPDSYASISQIQINWNNKNALLANASQFQLYDISRKNGVDLSFPSWSALDMPYNNQYIVDDNTGPLGYMHGLGSVICLEFGTDICLEPGESAGQVGTYNIYVQLQGQWKSYNYDMISTKGTVNANSPKTLELYMLFVTPAVFTIYDNAASQRIGVFSKEQAKNAPYVAGVEYRDTQEMLMSGGFKFKKAFKKAKQGIVNLGKQGFKSAKKMGRMGIAAVKPIAQQTVRDVQDVASRGIQEGIQKGLNVIGQGMKRMGGCQGRGMSVAGRKRKRSKSIGGRKKKKKKKNNVGGYYPTTISAITSNTSAKRGGKIISKNELKKLINQL